MKTINCKTYTYISNGGREVKISAASREEADQLIRGASITSGVKYFYSHYNITYQGRELKNMT